MSDFLVNTNVAGAQYEPDVTVLSNGNYVIVWTSDDGLDAGSNPAAGIRAQLFSSDGTPVGSEILVNSIGEEVQSSAAVQALPGGGFAVVWASQDMADWETSGTVIRGRIFDAAGTPAAADFAITTENDSQSPSITALDGGNYLVTWTGMDLVNWQNDVIGQVIDASGALVGESFVVSAEAEGEQAQVVATTLSGGAVATVFVQLDESWSPSVYVRLFDATATTPGVEFLVSGADPADSPAVAALADGGFVVLWVEEDGIFGQRFDASGGTVGSAFEATSQDGGSQNAAQVIGLPNGGYFVVWHAQDQSYLGQSYVGDGVYSYAIRGRFYNADGEAVAEDVVINTTTAGVQTQPKLTLLDDGRIVVTYQSGDGEQGAANGTAIRALIVEQPASFEPDAEPTDFVATPAAAAFAEDTALGTVVATLAATDPEGGAITYEILNFAGGKFEVVGDEVRLRAPLDYEAAHSYEVLVRATDSAGNVVDTSFTVGVTDVAETPAMAVTGTHSVTVNSTNPMSITLAGGRFVVAYQDQTASATQAQVYNADGTPDGAAFTLESTSLGTENGPSLAALPDGGFVAVWNVSNTIYMRAFDSSLSAAPQVQVSTTAGGAGSPSVAIFENGSFVVAWAGQNAAGDGDSSTIRARLFAADGTAAANDFIVVTTTEGYASPTNEAVTALAGGRFVVTWTANDSQGSNPDGGTVIRARVFEADGTPVGDDFQVNATATSYQNTASIIALQDGGFLVVWQSDDGGDAGHLGTFEGSSFLARGQIFDASGTPVGAELVLNDVVDGQQYQVRAAQLDSGLIAVAYLSSESAGSAVVSDTVRLALFEADGTPVGESFVVAKDFNAQNLTFGNPQVTALADGHVAVTWQTFNSGSGLNGVTTRIVDTDPEFDPVELALSSTTVSEDAVVGTVVGTLSAVDPDGGALSYTLDDDAGGKFEIVGNELRVKAALDHEAAASHVVTVTVTDDNGGQTTEDITISVGDVNEAPAIRVAGGIPHWAATPMSPALDGPRGVLAVDVDGDGDLDIVATGYIADNLVWYENDGGTFGAAASIATGLNGAFDVAAADGDGDGDGDQDLLVSVALGDQVVYLRNNGDGSFSPSVLGSLNGARGAAFADLDGDGDADALVAGSDGDEVLWYANDGTGTFGSAQSLASGTAADGAYAVEVTDVDDDGDADILVAATNADQVLLIRNLGDGTFAAATPVATGIDGARSIAMGDIDDDGDVDMVVAAYNGDSVVWYRNDGTGAFTQAGQIASGNGMENLQLADTDGDGDLDVVAAAYFDDVVIEIENLGGSFAAPRLVATGPDAPTTVAVADLDGDGAGEVVVGAYAGDEVSVLQKLAGSVSIDFGVSSPLTGLAFADDGSGPVVVSLAVTDGSFAATSDGGVVVAGEGTGALTLTGTVADINAFIAAGAVSVTIPVDSSTRLVVSIDDQLGQAKTAAVQFATGALPTDLALTGNTVNENASEGAIVGTLSATDPEGGSLTYTLLDHADLFSIDSSSGTPTLVTRAPLDHETVASYDVRIAASDETGNAVIETFTISVADVNDAPAIGFTPADTLYETDSGGTVVGTFSLTDADGTPVSAVLTNSAGGRFALETVGEEVRLVSVGPFDYELSPTHSVTIQASDGTAYTTRSFTIDVADVVETGSAPSDIVLSNTTVSEGQRTGSTVGTLSATDADGDPLTFFLPSVDDNEWFLLRDNDDGTVSVILSRPLDFESSAAVNGVYDLVVDVSDGNGNTTRATIGVQSTDEAFDISSVPTGKDYMSVVESAPVGTELGFVETFDGSFVPVSAEIISDPSGKFGLETREVGGVTRTYLVVNGELDHETGALHAITVRATNAGGASEEKTFEIHVLDAAETGDTARGTITIDASTARAASNGGVDWNTYLDAQYAKVVASLPMGVAFAPATSSEYLYALTDGTFLSLKGSDLAYWWADPETGEDAHVVGGTITSLTFGAGSGMVLNDPELTISGLDLTNDAGMLNRIYGEANITAVTWMYGPDANHPADIEFVKAALASYAQNFLGSSAGDVYTGTLFDDTVSGNGGADTLAGAGGNDAIDGGEGSDTAVFGGNKADYTVTRNDDGTWTVADNRSGEENDGTDTLTSVEFAQFADQVQSLNENPVAGDDSLTTLKGQPRVVNVLGNDVDADGTLDPTSVTIVDGPLHGSVSVNATTGAITYTPGAAYTGSDSFTYTVKDNGGAVSGAATVSVAVVEPYVLTEGDDVFSGDSLGWTAAPIAVNGLGGHDYIVTSNIGTQPDTIYGGDGNDLIFTGRGDDYIDGGAGDDVIHARAGNETVIGGAGNDTFAIRFFGTTTDTGTTTITDDDGVLWNGTFRPASYPGSWSPAPSATSGFAIGGTATIVSEGVWDLAVTDQNSVVQHFTLSWSGGDLTITGGTQTAIIKNYVNGTFGMTLESAPADEAPTGLSLSASSIAEDAGVGSVVGVLSASDPEGGAVTYALSADADGKFEIVGNQLRLKAGLDYETKASHAVSVTVSDAGGNTSTKTFAIAVTDVLEPTVAGDSGKDKLKGTKGDDIAFGGGGKDKIDGGKGDDILVGGAGKDKLTGGKGADVFLFQFASDSTVKGKGRDIIEDFKRKQGDKIDVSAIDPINDSGAFEFIGKAKFGKEAGELRYDKKGGKTLISGDIDGDGKADFAIQLSKAMTMKEADFVL